VTTNSQLASPPLKLSLELLAAEAESVVAAHGLLAPGTHIFVPWLPRQDLALTRAALRTIAAHGHVAVPHVAARRVRDPLQLERLLGAAVTCDRVSRVLLVAGDAAEPAGPFKDARAVLDSGLLVRAGLREVGFAVHPEGHPHIERHALRALHSKIATAQAQGLGVFLVSQFSFAPRRILECASTLLRELPTVPLMIGIAGPTDPLKLLRYARLCGVNATGRALSQLGTGIARLAMHTDPGEQVRLIAHQRAIRHAANIAGMHFFSFGGFLATARWLAMLALDGDVEAVG
jgi:methylenetetrahydrofolate reductase (NADPH)